MPRRYKPCHSAGTDGDSTLRHQRSIDAIAPADCMSSVTPREEASHRQRVRRQRPTMPAVDDDHVTKPDSMQHNGQKPTAHVHRISRFGVTHRAGRHNVEIFESGVVNTRIVHARLNNAAHGVHRVGVDETNAAAPRDRVDHRTPVLLTRRRIPMELRVFSRRQFFLPHAFIRRSGEVARFGGSQDTSKRTAAARVEGERAHRTTRVVPQQARQTTVKAIGVGRSSVRPGNARISTSPCIRTHCAIPSPRIRSKAGPTCAHRAGTAGSRERHHHADLHACKPGEPHRDISDLASKGKIA